MKKNLRVVIYLRCSSPKQELSVADQRREVEAFCKLKHYTIVREYVDEGKSASKNKEKRVAFNKMILDSHKRDFDVVVCWDAARFTRFDNIEGSVEKDILRKNGIFMDTVKEGEFNWSTPEGRWKDMAYCEANKALALNLSKDAIRGRVNALALGFWCNGSIPYGYDKKYTDGVKELFFKRSDKFSKGRNWHLKLVVNTTEAEVVKDIFNRYVNLLQPMRQIAKELTALGIPSPAAQGGASNGAWVYGNINTILHEKAYIGIASIGNGLKKEKVVHNSVSVTEKPNSCPVIVDTDLWHRAQDLKTKRKVNKERPQSRGGVLSGFLICGHCGYRLAANKSKKTTKGTSWTKYDCVSQSVRPHLSCHHYSIKESVILPKLAKWLVTEVDQEILLQLDVEPGEVLNVTEADHLAAHIKSLEEKINAAEDSALLAPPSRRESVWAKVALMQEELDNARRQHKLLNSSKPELDDIQKWWLENRELLVEVAAAIPFSMEAYLSGEVTLKDAHQEDESLPDVTLHRAHVWKDQLRGLLASLSCEVRIFWETTGARRGGSQGTYAVSSVSIKGCVNVPTQPFVQEGTGIPSHKRLSFNLVRGL